MTAKNPLSKTMRGHRIQLAGQDLVLTPTEYRIWQALSSSPGEVFTRSDLVALAIESIVLDRTIDVHVKTLRKKLGNAARMIQTVRGKGYRLMTSDDQQA